MNVIPISSWSAFSSIWSALRSLASRAPSGSSRSSTDGFSTRDRASATRCCWPPESWVGLRFSIPLNCTNSRARPILPRGGVLAQVLVLQAEPDVLLHREVGEQGIALEDGVHRPFVRGCRRHVDPVDHDRPGVGSLEPGDQPERGGLPAARRPEQREELAIVDPEIDVVDRGDIAESS